MSFVEKWFRRAPDPIGVYVSLRDAGILGSHSYLHMSGDTAEIGWAPVDHLRIGYASQAAARREQLAKFAAAAACRASKAFGYVAFDAFDGFCGAKPDAATAALPLIELVIPGETVTIGRDGTRYRGSGRIDLAPHLGADFSPAALPPEELSKPRPTSSARDATYVEAVRSGIAALERGEAQKLVLSRHMTFEADYDPADVLARLAPDFVDGFLLSFGALTAVVPSPELLLDARSRRITTNPLAGTRPRGADPVADERLRAELETNPKEIVEHVVSVRTVLAELAQVCKPSSLAVNRLLEVARQPRVQHLSSVVAGELDEGRSVLDAFWALFPAVTVAGLPKAEAVAIMRRLERLPRHLYAGAVGWVSGTDDCRFSLALRGIVRNGRRSTVQAGAGILPASSPEAEWQETEHKLAGITHSLAAAAGAAARMRERRRVPASPIPQPDAADALADR